MTDFRMRLIIETILKDEKLLKQLKKDLEGVDSTAKKSQGGLKGFTDKIGAMKGQIVAAGAILLGFGIAVKKTFDFARQGAAIGQLTQSFDGFLERAGITTDLLGELQEAAKGTIPDFELMTSVMTLVMGTTGGLQTALLEATPRLLEIAKAANKLNPALGSTTFLFESLARGIKRASPLILDNLGVVIKVGEAYQTYADSVGKTIANLTAIDKTQAVLNAALEAGIPLLDQAGGTTESLTDEYDKLSTNVVNSKNAFLVWLDTAIAPSIMGLNQLVFSTEDMRLRLDSLESALLSGKISFEEYTTGMALLVDWSERAALITDLNVVSLEKYNLGLAEFGQASLDNVGTVLQLSEAEATALIIEQKRIAILEGLVFALDHEGKTVEEVRAELLGLTGDEEAATKATQDLTEAIIDANTEFAKIRTAFIDDPFSGIETGLVSRLESILEARDFAAAGGQAIQEFTDVVNTALFDGRITEQQADALWENILISAQSLEVKLGNIDFEGAAKALADSLGISPEEAEELLANVIPLETLKNDLEEAKIIVQEGINELVNLQPTGGLAEEAGVNLFAGLDETADEARSALAQAFGLMESDILALGDTFDNLAERADFSEEQILEIQTAINALKSKEITITINYVTTGNPPGGVDAAHGLDLTIPQGFPNDSFFLPLNVQSGEVVTVTPDGRTPPSSTTASGDININAPININSEANQTLEQMVQSAIPTANI